MPYPMTDQQFIAECQKRAAWPAPEPLDEPARDGYPSIADLRTAIDVLDSLTTPGDMPEPCIDDAQQLLQTLLLNICPHERLATGPQCLDCGARL